MLSKSTTRQLPFRMKIMNKLRLQKYLSECGVASRRAAESLIEEAKVRVNGKVAILGQQVDPEHDKIQVRDKIVRPAPKGVLLFYKPKEVVSTMSDPQGRRCLADFITKPYRSYFPVGRLDWDSTGLVILTNDGELAERLLHPRYGFERVYHVRVAGELRDKEMARIERGVRLSDGIAKAQVKFLRRDDDATWLELRLQEGRNRIVRRMMDHIRHPVLKLQRIAHGPCKLGKLKPGDLRRLTEDEYRKLRGKVFSRECWAKDRKYSGS